MSGAIEQSEDNNKTKSSSLYVENEKWFKMLWLSIDQTINSLLLSSIPFLFFDGKNIFKV